MQNLYPPDLRDLLQSEMQLQIYRYVINQTKAFNPRDVMEGLQREGIHVPLIYVQKYLRALNVSNFITGLLYRDRRRRGRSCICYLFRKR